MSILIIFLTFLLLSILLSWYLFRSKNKTLEDYLTNHEYAPREKLESGEYAEVEPYDRQ